MTPSRTFARRLDMLPEIFAFTAAASRPQGLGDGILRAVELVLEELFTNIVKYGEGASPVTITIEPVPGGLQVTLDDPDAAHFDVTQPPAVDTTLPIEQRRPGGLGLHLINRLVDCIEYRYIAADRHSQVRFRKTQTAPSTGGAETSLGVRDAQD